VSIEFTFRVLPRHLQLDFTEQAIHVAGIRQRQV
jgi:hypothetical protein